MKDASASAARWSAGREDVQSPPRAGVAFHWANALLGAWLIFGMYLDGWAHVHLEETQETFFTPWHGVLYSGYLAGALLLAGAAVRNRARGHAWRWSLPAGYDLALLGALIFGVGGAGDMLWHTLLGIETDTEALLSPPHLLLALGAGLMITGPLRAAGLRPHGDAGGWLTMLPPILSASTFIALIGFFTSYVHPFARTLASAVSAPGTHSLSHARLDLGVAGILLQSGILAGVVLLLVRRWGSVLPLGSMTLLIALPLTLLVWMFDVFLDSGPLPLFFAALAAGLFTDGLYRTLSPSPDRIAALRAFAFAVPAILFAAYFAALAFTTGLWWSMPMWTGAIVLAGVVGSMLSYAFIAPESGRRMPNE